MPYKRKYKRSGGRRVKRRRLQPQVGALAAHVVGQALSAAARKSTPYLAAAGLGAAAGSSMSTRSRARSRSASRSRSRSASNATVRRLNYGSRFRNHTYGTRIQAKLGKLTRKKYKKLMQNYFIQRWQNIAPMTSPGGAYQLRNQVQTDVSDRWRVPLFVMDVSSVVNNVQGVQTFPTALYGMYVSSGGGINFAPDVNVGPTNAQTTTWNLENTSAQSNIINVPHARSIFEWLQVKMNLHGAKQRTTRFNVMLCQIDQRVIPSDLNGFTTFTDPALQQFWASLITRYVRDPITPSPVNFPRSYMKVLKSYNFTVDSATTTDEDPDPHMVTQKMFFKLNRLQNYGWQPNVNTVVTPDQIYGVSTGQPAQFWDQDLGENSTRVHPNARLYLIIRATNWFRTTEPSINPQSLDTCPTFDLLVRAKHIINS